MLTFGSLSFAVPWALAAFALLPALWWLLRLTPPAPLRIAFPPVRLLFKLKPREESAAKSPLWLLLLRLALAAVLILGAAHPLINAQAQLEGQGPLALLIDDGWAAAANWPARAPMLASLLDQAERQNRPVVVVTTAPVEERRAAAVETLSPRDARRALEAVQPKPWPTDRAAAVEALLAPGALGAGVAAGVHVVWLSDGLAQGDTARMVRALRGLGAVTVVQDVGERLPLVLKPPVSDGEALRLTVQRAVPGRARSVPLVALADEGRVLAREVVRFTDGATEAEARLVLPAELRNALARIEIDGEATAARVVLVDERWRRRPVGLVSGEGAGVDQPLLSDTYYLERALEPFTEIRRGPVEELLKRELAVITLADPGLSEGEQRDLLRWIETGGIVVRFAGPRLAQEQLDEPAQGRTTALLPARLRLGDRVMGGTMSWNRPVGLAPFEELSPFHGLAVPGDVRVSRQVLAHPAPDLADKTWARLSDGTPLVTAEKRGKGWLVLIHITANAQWSNLPLSGLFVGMLQRIVALSQGVVAKAGGPPLAPLEVLDGFGRLGLPSLEARAVPAEAFEATRAQPRHPPGYYGDKTARRALNLSAGLDALAPLGPLPDGVKGETYGSTLETDLRPWFLGLAFLLALADLVASLVLRGLLGWRRAAVAAVLLGVGLAAPAATWAQGSAPSPRGGLGGDAFAQHASADPILAYVITGNREVDEISRAGLNGLSVLVRRRTAAELGAPLGVNIERDELAFFPLLYWPLVPGQPPPSDAAAARVNAYMRGGGTILFDTRDQGGLDQVAALRDLARRLDIPRLVPVPPNHVLTRAFYLMQEFPGRFAGGTLWVERAGERVNDGVSPVIAGSHDWAAAWAMDDAQRPLFPAVPGGERQRELAYRFGINLVMYTLTGNYKSDQVHVPAIMQRLGR
jgi:hypothetical protein